MVAASRAIAEDAAEKIAIEWEPLAVVADAAAAWSRMPPGSMRPAMSHRAGRSISAMSMRRWRALPSTVRETFSVQRHSAMPLETRGLLAQFDRARRMLEVFGPTKVPHTNRALLAAMLNNAGGRRSASSSRTSAAASASRGEFYPEDFLIPWLAMRLRRPIRWIEDRFEHFSAINHSRECHVRRWRPAAERGRHY